MTRRSSVFRSPDPTAPNDMRAVSWAAIVVGLVMVASACGGGSSASGAKNPDATFKAALQLQKQGKLSAAAQLYQQVITAEPNNVFARYDLGVVDQASNDPVGALQAYGEALTINPKYVPALYNEATIYATTDPISAISLYRQIVALQPTAPTAYLNLGLLEIKHGAPKQGVSDLTSSPRCPSTSRAWSARSPRRRHRARRQRLRPRSTRTALARHRARRRQRRLLRAAHATRLGLHTNPQSALPG
jgi:tetratricopeptide (TPR) repeat protein